MKLWNDYLGKILPTGEVRIPVYDSRERITSRPVYAYLSSPFFHSAAMDGYAVRFDETFGASEKSPLKLKLKEQAFPVNTGEPLPKGFNAVVMVEDIHQEGEFIEIQKSLTPYKNIRTVGEDIVQTELILPENHRIRSVDIGATLAGGHTEIYVRRKPRVTIIPTGNEVVRPGDPLKAGNVVDFNSYMIGSLVQEWGGECEQRGIAPDDKALLKDIIFKHLKSCDFIVLIAGSSAGTRDFTPNAIQEIGEVIVHGINIKPGKPVLLGSIEGKPVIGLPGYPVSAYIAFELFGKPLISRLLCTETEKYQTLQVSLSRPVSSTIGQEEFLRVKIGKVGNKYIATPVGRGAGAIMTLQRADGLLQIPAMSEGVAPQTEADVRLLRSRNSLDNTIVCIGSHDNTLDILANHIKRRFPLYSLSSAHVGSMGGIIAIKKNEAHIAGCHLLDEPSGEYNVPFIKKSLKGVSLKVYNLVYRQQGLIVRKGNPKNVQGIDDLTRNDCLFINRQPGSGTRLLTDTCLREKCIDARKIQGYNKEEYTHMGVASAISTGVADTGMGILAAALALNLEFIPIAKERFDLIVREEYVKVPMIRALLEIISSDEEFRTSVMSRGGYDISEMGSLIYEQTP
jgi:putative molybdopterin biosynthesis protein